MPEFTLSPNSYGRVAGGQEGSGQAQILQPYDSAKFMKAEMEAKKNQAKVKPETYKLETPIEIKKGQPQVLVDPEGIIVASEKSTTDLTIKNAIPLNDVTNELEKEMADLLSRGTKIDATDRNAVAAYNTEMIELKSRIGKNDSNINMSVEQVKRSEDITNAVNKDKDGLVNLEATLANQIYANGLPVRKSLEYSSNNPMVVYNSNLDYTKYISTMSGIFSKNFNQIYGSDTPFVEDATTGRMVWDNTKSKSIPVEKVDKQIKDIFRGSVAASTRDADVYSFLLSYKDSGSEKTYQQEAADAGVKTVNKLDFADWVYDNKKDFVKQMIELPDVVTSKKVLGENNDGGGTNVVVNLTTGSPTVTSGATSTTGGTLGLANARNISPSELATGENVATPSPEFIVQDGSWYDGSGYTVTSNTSWIPFVAPSITDINLLPISVQNKFRTQGIKSGQPLLEDDAALLYRAAEVYPEILNNVRVSAFAMANAKSGDAEAQGYWKIDNAPAIGQPVRDAYRSNAVQITSKWNTAYKPSKYPKIANTGNAYTNALTLASQFPDANFDVMLKAFDNHLSNGKSVTEAYDILYQNYGGANQ